MVQKKHLSLSLFAAMGDFLSRLMNIAPHEAPRVILAWSLKFCLYTGYTIGWTMLTAMLVNRLGIEYLPLLLVANAGLTILGTVGYAEIIHRFDRKLVLFTTLVVGLMTLVGAISILLTIGNLVAFFAGALAANAIFFAQLNILIGLLAEELFSPLEGERAWPIIDTSKYIGGIVGGLLILFGISVLHIEAPLLTFMWIGAIALVGPILTVHYFFQRKLPTFTTRSSNPVHIFGHMREGLRNIRLTPFLAGLAVVVLLHGVFYTLLSFQYTQAVDAEIGAEAHATTAGATHASAENTHAHEDLLTHGLGALYIGFSVVTLFVQLFFTSRIMERIGIVRTLTLHPTVSMLASLGMAAHFGFLTAVTGKAAFSVTTAIYTSAYYASFYALRESVREHAKEFLEGIVAPLGVIVGTLLLFAAQQFFIGKAVTSTVAALLILSAAVMGGTLVWLRERYTHVSKKNLELFGNHPAKFTSVEVLAQAGHINAAEILVKSLTYKKESEQLRVKILETLGHLRDPQTIPQILTCFHDPSPRVKLAAVQSLGEFTDLGKQFYTQAFTHYRVITALKELFETENSKEIRSAIVHVFSNLNQIDVVPFLIETLQIGDESVRADCVYVCGLFHDVSAAHYLEPFLTSSDPYTKANAIIALWQFPHYRLRLTILLTSLLEADDRPSQKAAIHMLGEIGAIQEKPRLEAYLASDDDELRLLAALALAKLNHDDAPEILADYILHDNSDLATLAEKHLRHIPESIRKHVDRIVHHRLSEQLNHAIRATDETALEDFPPDILEHLRSIYTRADEWDEVAKIDAALAGRTLD